MLNFAIQTARDAGQILAERFGRAIQITHKGDIDIVTESDLAAERLIVERIRSYYPRHAILAEESGASLAINDQQSEFRWIIDPLDGTTNYAHGYPCFCVSIALEHHGRIEIGVIYDPSRDEVFAAERGAGATLNGRSIRVSDVNELNRALLCTGFPYDVRERGDFARHFSNFIMHAQAVRRDGSAALDLAYVACGRFDGFWEEYRKPSLSYAKQKLSAHPTESHLHSESILDGLRPWDVAAGVLLIREAGGMVTDERKNTLQLDFYDVMLTASNGLIQDQMIDVLKL